MVVFLFLTFIAMCERWASVLEEGSFPAVFPFPLLSPLSPVFAGSYFVECSK